MSKKIKLVVGISDFRIGGAQKLMSDLVRNINLEHFDVTLVTLFQSAGESDFYDLIPDKVKVIKLKFKNFYNLRSWIRLIEFLIKIKPDVVCSNLFFSNTVFRLLKIFFSYKVVTIEHNVYVNKILLHKIIDKLLSLLTFRIVAVSESVLDYTAKTQRIDKRMFSVISNGVDVDYFFNEANKTDVSKIKQELGFATEDKIIITVGQLIKQKNHILLVQAFAEFCKHQPLYKLVIVGEGSNRELIESEIKKLGIENQVRMTGIRKDVAALYAASDFFVLPSTFEGFALVCIEAMTTSLPVISTNVAGPNHYVKDGVNGYFTELDSSDLSEKMLLLANQNQSERESFATRARETARQYDIKKTVSEYEKLFTQAATNSKSKD